MRFVVLMAVKVLLLVLWFVTAKLLGICSNFLTAPLYLPFTLALSSSSSFVFIPV
jgi:hypothetical protein